MWVGYEEARDICNNLDLPQQSVHRHCHARANRGIAKMINLRDDGLGLYTIRYRCQDCGRLIEEIHKKQ